MVRRIGLGLDVVKKEKKKIQQPENTESSSTYKCHLSNTWRLLCIQPLEWNPPYNLLKSPVHFDTGDLLEIRILMEEIPKKGFPEKVFISAKVCRYVRERKAYDSRTYPEGKEKSLSAKHLTSEDYSGMINHEAKWKWKILFGWMPQDRKGVLTKAESSKKRSLGVPVDRVSLNLCKYVNTIDSMGVNSSFIVVLHNGGRVEPKELPPLSAFSAEEYATERSIALNIDYIDDIGRPNGPRLLRLSTNNGPYYYVSLGENEFQETACLCRFVRISKDVHGIRWNSELLLNVPIWHYLVYLDAMRESPFKIGFKDYLREKGLGEWIEEECNPNIGKNIPLEYSLKSATNPIENKKTIIQSTLQELRKAENEKVDSKWQKYKEEHPHARSRKDIDTFLLLTQIDPKSDDGKRHRERIRGQIYRKNQKRMESLKKKFQPI